MKKIISGLLLVLLLLIGGYSIYDHGRPAPIPMREKLSNGVIYRRIVQVTPRPFIAHIIIVDRVESKARFLVTPPDDAGNDLPLKARTTSQFLSEFGLQIAINGDGFSPWWSRSPADYYPHVGDPVRPLGLTASNGKLYATDDPERPGTAPTLYINRQNRSFLNIRPDGVWTAISGDRILISNGDIVNTLDDTERDPRTAIGLKAGGRYVYFVVIDGRQPFYSEGATFLELAELLESLNVTEAMALDGGGSSTMVIQGDDGEPVIVNSPIDNYIPGRERPVANHLGVFLP